MRPRLGKPPLGVLIPAGSPLSAGLISAWLMNEGGGTITREALQRNQAGRGLLSAGSSWVGAKDGVGIYLNAAGSEFIGIGFAAPILQGLSQFTHWERIKIVSFPGNGKIAALWTETADNFTSLDRFGAWIDCRTAPLRNSLLVNIAPLDGGTITTVQTALNSLALGVWYDVVVTFDSIANVTNVYLNGVLAATGAATSAVANTPTPGINFGAPNFNSFGSNGIAPDVVLEGAMWWKRPLRIAEILALGANPYQAFHRPQRRDLGGFRAPVAYSITLSESMTATATMNKQPQLALHETAVLTALLAKQARKVIANSVTTNDALSRFTAKQLVETASATDTRTNFLRRLFSESAAAADSVALHVVVKTIVLSETVTLLDTRRSLVRRTFAEVATATDSVVVSHLFLKTLLEAVTLSDSRTSRVSRSFAEAAIAHDVLALRTMFARTLAETVTATDSIVRKTSRSLPESLVMIDDLKKLLSRAMLEMTVLADAVAKSVSRDLSEAVVLADSLHTHRSVEALFVETLLALDNLVRTAGKNLPETITTSDQFHFDMAREFVEAVQAVDALGLGRYLTLTEAVALVDAVLTAIVPNPAQVVESIWGRAPQKLVWGRIGAKLVWHRNGGQ